MESLDHALLAGHLGHGETCTGNCKGGSRWGSRGQHLWVVRVRVDGGWGSCIGWDRSRRHHPLRLRWSRGSDTVLSIAVGSRTHHRIRAGHPVIVRRLTICIGIEIDRVEIGRNAWERLLGSLRSDARLAAKVTDRLSSFHVGFGNIGEREWSIWNGSGTIVVFPALGTAVDLDASEGKCTCKENR